MSLAWSAPTKLLITVSGTLVVSSCVIDMELKPYNVNSQVVFVLMLVDITDCNLTNAGRLLLILL